MLFPIIVAASKETFGSHLLGIFWVFPFLDGLPKNKKNRWCFISIFVSFIRAAQTVTSRWGVTLTVQCLDRVDVIVAHGQRALRAAVMPVAGKHDGRGISGVSQTQWVAQFMGRHSRQAVTWTTLTNMQLLPLKQSVTCGEKGWFGAEKLWHLYTKKQEWSRNMPQLWVKMEKAKSCPGKGHSSCGYSTSCRGGIALCWGLNMFCSICIFRKMHINTV